MRTRRMRAARTRCCCVMRRWSRCRVVRTRRMRAVRWRPRVMRGRRTRVVRRRPCRRTVGVMHDHRSVRRSIPVARRVVHVPVRTPVVVHVRYDHSRIPVRTTVMMNVRVMRMPVRAVLMTVVDGVAVETEADQQPRQVDTHRYLPVRVRTRFARCGKGKPCQKKDQNPDFLHLNLLVLGA
ncbi:MAG: hypothetical protein ABIA47_04140 [bacterium]